MKNYLFGILFLFFFSIKGLAQSGNNNNSCKSDTTITHIHCVSKKDKDKDDDGRSYTHVGKKPVMKLKVSAFSDTCNSGMGMAMVSVDSNGYPPYHYHWSNGQITSAAFSLTQNCYNITVTDSKGNSATSSVTIQNTNATISLTGTVTQPLCAGNTGKICITPNGGPDTSYRGLWSNGASGLCVANLVSGNYSVTVTDQHGCKSNANFAVKTPPSSISINARVIQPVCVGSTGAIGIEPTGGTGPSYTAHWSNGRSGYYLDSLPPGTYSVTVTDQNGCTAYQSYALSEPDSIQIQYRVSPVSCDSALPGSIVLKSVSNATSPYTFSWSGSNGYSATSANINHLIAGNYTVSLTDANGCTASAAYTLSTKGRINATYTVINSLCNGLSTGSVNFVNLSPDSSARFSWSGPGGLSASTASIHNLASGVYNLTISENNGCITSFADTVKNSSAINLQFTATPVKCDSSIGGKLTNVSISGTTGSWSVLWTGPNGYSSSALNISHLNIGNYAITLTDSLGCVGNANYTLTSSGSITTAYVVTSTSCPEANNGLIDRALLKPYSSPTFYWTGPNGFTSDSTSIFNLAPGIYRLLVTEPYGCKAVRNDTVHSGLPISMQFTATPVKCDIATGGTIINTGVTGATYPWVVSWSGPGGFSSNSVSLYGLSHGTYTINYTDANGCTGNGSYFVDSTGVVNVDYEASNSNCMTNNNGSLKFVSLTPYSILAKYAWLGDNNFKSSAQSISELGPGNYSVTVQEDFGCKAMNSYAISSCVDVGVVSIKNVNCPAPGMHLIVHPIVGDVSQVNGGHCASGASGQIALTYTGAAHYTGCANGGLVPSVKGNTLTWTITDFGAVNIDSSFFIILNVDSSAVLGSQIGITVHVSADRDDCDSANNTSNYSMTVINSYDPNTKQVFPDGAIDASEKTLSYTVVFQNTGTGPAHNVLILDTLSRNIISSSLKVLASSNPVQALLSGSAIQFNFMDINLPTVSTDSAASLAWVQYSVQPEDNLPVGAVINNTAYIYFDLNAPVVTNTTNNTIISKTSVGLNSTGLDFVLFPNPAHNNALILVDNEALGGWIEVIDATGRICRNIQVTNNSFNLPLNELASGFYLARLISPTGKATTIKLSVD